MGTAGTLSTVATTNGVACKGRRRNLIHRGQEREVKGTEKWCTRLYAEVFEQRRVFGVLEDRSGDIKTKRPDLPGK